MTNTQEQLSRRRFLGAATAAAAAVGRLPRGLARASGVSKQRKTILSFYCDDTGPAKAGVKAFSTFLDYCAEQGIRGESSAILGASGHSMAREPNEEEAAYLAQVRRAWTCGIDSHMEIMTHQGLFEFASNREPAGVIHEGLWLHEPLVTVQEYERYFANIVEEGKRANLLFTGLTWPGCSCDACTRRYAQLRSSGQTKPNPAFWSALLNLARQGRFRSRTVPCFFDASESDFGIHLKASDGQFAVYDLMPNAMDRFGIWENNPARVDPDYYITEDGKSGIIVQRVENGAPYCIWYAHWQGLNPGNGVGWRAFTMVVERVRKHLRERVVWMRPSDITNRYHEAGSWEFLDRL